MWPISRNDQDARRSQLLDEASRIIGERGYYGFAVQDLAERCGLTTAGLLYHFKTKERLLLAVLGERDRRAEAVLMPLIAGFSRARIGGPLALPEVHRLLRTMIEITVAQPELSRLFVILGVEALNKGHPGHAYFREREAKVLEAYTNILEPHVAEPRSTARQISALMLGLQQQWLASDGEMDLLAEWDRAAAAILPELGGAAARSR